MTANTLEDYCWLIGDEGATWCDSLSGDTRPLLQQAKQLRKQLSASRTHLLLELLDLRQRAAAKFDAASRMFFTSRTLEQATDQWIADYKAERFPADGPIADVCCGIGGDLFGLAARGETTGVDLEPIHALLARANCDALGLPIRDIQTADATTLDLKPFAAWHIDPDRRPAGQRTTSLDYSMPTASAIDSMLQQLPHAALKSAPAADLPEHWKPITERQWIGSGRECKQQVVWFGDLAQHAGKHSAAVVHHRVDRSDLLVGMPAEPIDVATCIESYVFEPHAAVLAAQLTGTLAHKYNLLALDSNVEYLTANHPIDDPLLSCFAVIDTLPFDLRHLRSALQHHDIGLLEVKKRGVPIEPDEVRRKVQGRGVQQATVLLTPHAGSVQAIICRRSTLA